MCSKFTMKTPDRRHWRRSDIFIVNSEHIPHLFLVFLLLELEQVNLKTISHENIENNFFKTFIHIK